MIRCFSQWIIGGVSYCTILERWQITFDKKQKYIYFYLVECKIMFTFEYY